MTRQEVEVTDSRWWSSGADLDPNEAHGSGGKFLFIK